MLRTARAYDVIISDSTHPGTADSWVLYTEEFYRLCRRAAEAGTESSRSGFRCTA